MPKWCQFQVYSCQEFGLIQEVGLAILQLERTQVEVGPVELLQFHSLVELHVQGDVQPFGQLLLEVVQLGSARGDCAYPVYE